MRLNGTHRHAFALLLCLVVVACTSCSASSSDRATNPQPLSTLVDAAFFPRFHVRPERNWVNDPNGPFYDPKHKRYHLWLQYNPYGSDWGDMSWYHLVSPDLVSWRRLGVTLYNDDPTDSFGVFSGSVTVLDDGGLVMSYTCVNASQAQKQCAAVPVDRDGDPDLVEWRRVPGNPLVHQGPFENERTDLFRDPGVGFRAPAAAGGAVKYRQIVATFYEPDVAAIALYDSANLTADLRFAGILLEVKTLLRLMMECPDYFPLADVVLGGADDAVAGMALFKYSDMASHQDVWHVGFNDVANATGAQTWTAACPAGEGPAELMERCDIDGTPGRPVGGAVDYGLFYASVTFWDAPNKRRVLWGWLDDEYDHGAYPPSRDWRGAQSLPRLVTYDAALRHLRTPPIPELRALRRESIVRPPANGSTTAGADATTRVFPMAIETEFGAPSVTNRNISAPAATQPVYLTRRAPASDSDDVAASTNVTASVIGGVAAVKRRKKRSVAARLLGGDAAGSAAEDEEDLVDAQYEVVAVISVDRATFAAARRVEVGLDVLVDDWAGHRRAKEGAAAATRRTFVGVVVDRRLGHMRSRQIRGGGEYRHVSTVTSAPNRTAREEVCASICTADIRCIAWTHDDGLKRCFLKARINSVSPKRTVPNRAAGVLPVPMFGVWRGRSGTEGHSFPQFGRVVDLRTTANGTRYVFELRVFVDRTIVEAFKDGGLERVATHVYNPRATWLVAAVCRVTSAGAKRARASSAATVESFEAWRLGSIWPDPRGSRPASQKDGRGAGLWGSVMKKRNVAGTELSAAGGAKRPPPRQVAPRPAADGDWLDAHVSGFGEPEHGNPALTAHPTGWNRGAVQRRVGRPGDASAADGGGIFGTAVATSLLWATAIFAWRRRRGRVVATRPAPPTDRPGV